MNLDRCVQNSIVKLPDINISSRVPYSLVPIHCIPLINVISSAYFLSQTYLHNQRRDG
jgi:hypothetical protein